MAEDKDLMEVENLEEHHHEHDHHEHDEVDVVYLTLDDDTELECAVIDIFPLDEKHYIALAPIDDEDEQVLIYRYNEGENEEDIEISTIDSDEEFDRVADEFNRLMDEYEAEYEEE